MIGARIGAPIGATIGIVADGQTSLAVTLVDSSDPVPINTQFTYSCIITNTGSSNALNVVVSINIDGDLTTDTAVGSGWLIDSAGNSFTCTRSILAPGVAPTITVTVESGGIDEVVRSTADASADNAPAAIQAAEETTIST